MFRSSLGHTRVYQEAKEEGRKEALERLREEGYKEGLELAKRDIALNMLRRNFPVKEVAEITGLTIEQIQTLQGQSSTEPS